MLTVPGLVWLAVFFALPIAALFATSLMVPVPGGDIGQFQPAFRVANYTEALAQYWPTFLRSFGYGLLATVLALLIGYPLAYVVAVKARRFPTLQALLLVLIIAPFFTSFILRTIAWRQILADEGVVVRTLQAVALLPGDGRLTATSFAVVAGPHVQLRAVHDAADLRLARAARPALRRGRAGPVRRAVDDVPHRDAGRCRCPAWSRARCSRSSPRRATTSTRRCSAPRGTQMIGNVIESRFFRVVDYPTAAALSFLLMATILALVCVYVRRAGTDDLV